MTVREGEQYRGLFELSRFPLGDGHELVYSPLTRAAQALPPSSLRLLEGCRTFATLEQHAARLCQELHLAPQQAPEIGRQLTALAQARLLLPKSELLAAIRQESSAPATRIAALGIPTRNRTHCLQRCLRSYLENVKRHGRQLECIVVDDSDDPGVRRDNRQLLQELETRYPGILKYAGAEERARYAEALIRQADLPPEEVRFGLLHDSGHAIGTGAGRNALLLHAAGDALLQVDDDTVCRLAPGPGAQRGLVFSSAYDPTEFWFLAEGEAPPLSTPGEEPDFLAVHEQLLGRSLGECQTRLDPKGTPDLNGAGTGFLRRLGSSGGRVRATAAGVMGDSGMGSPAYFLSLEGPSRARLLRSEEGYRHALARQQVLRSVNRPTICDGPFCMALNLALDNRDLLPPFTPVQRNQDGVFAALLQGCFEGAFFGFLPWMVLHQAPTSRQLSAEDFWRNVARLTSGQILQALIGSFHPGPNKADARKSLEALGRSLEDWGSAARADFEELVRLLVWNQLCRKAAQLESQLRESQGQPAFWANDVRRLLALWRQALPHRRMTEPADLIQDPGRDDALARFQLLLRRFGRFLQVWPDMIAAAKQLRAHGQRLATLVESKNQYV